jgi:hypothetical protein
VSSAAAVTITSTAIDRYLHVWQCHDRSLLLEIRGAWHA